MRLRSGDFVDDMEIVGLLGEGATSEVYLIKDHAGVFRALKLLSVHGSTHRRRMRTEGAALRHIRHENVVGVLAMVEHEGWMGVLMEYVAGPTLYRWMDTESTDVDEAVRLTRGILTGIDVLHQAGLVHRDLKPGNVLLDVGRDGVRPRLADFGLVKQLWENDGHTHTGVSMGTPTYMAPEQLKDASRVDGRADLFSVGCMLFEMLTGRPPFDRSDMFGAWKAIDQGHTAELDALPRDTPPRLRRTIAGLLEPDPERRLPDVDAVFEVLDGRRPRRPLPPAPPLEPGTPGAVRARQLCEDLYADVRTAEPGKQPDFRGIDPTTFSAENVEELMELIGGEGSLTDESVLKRAPVALWISSAVFVVLVGVAIWWALMPGVDTLEVGAAELADAAGIESGAGVETLPEADEPEGDQSEEGGTGLAANPASDSPTDASEPPSLIQTAAVVPTSRAKGTVASADPIPATAPTGGTAGPDAAPGSGSGSSDAVAAVAGGDAPASSGSAAGQGDADVGAGADATEGEEGSAEGLDSDDTDVLPEPATVDIAGDAYAVELVGGDGSIFAPGTPLPAGAYTVRARWTEADSFQRAGDVVVPEGETVSLRCLSAFLRCRP